MPDSHALTDWFKTMGVELHPDLYLADDPLTGLSVFTSAPLPENTTAVTVPASLCITNEVAHQHICELITAVQNSGFPQELPNLDGLQEPDWILLYLVVCRLAQQHDAPQGEWAKCLVHIPYVSHIPTLIPTPLHFSKAELVLLGATPLQAFTERRLRETKVDFVRASILLRKYLESSKDDFARHIVQKLDATPITAASDDELFSDFWLEGLELWRWAESAFTSRSFPSSLIGMIGCRKDYEHDPFALNDAASAANPRIYASRDTSPILIPAYYMFNHERARRVTWSHMPFATATQSSSATNASQGRVVMVLNYQTPLAHSQVFNNYGGKSNEEFLAAYGFTVPTTTDDSLALKLSATVQTDSTNDTPSSPYRANGQSHTYYWPNNYNGDKGDTNKYRNSPSDLIQELESWTRQTDSPPSDEGQSKQRADALEELERLLLAKRKAFKASQAHIQNHLNQDRLLTEVPSTWNPRSPLSHIRASVWQNVSQYRAGQMEILNKAVAWTRAELDKLADDLDNLDSENNTEDGACSDVESLP